MQDDQIIVMALDRSQKFNEITTHVLENRAKTLAFVNTTDQDLRNHFMDHPVLKLSTRING